MLHAQIYIPEKSEHFLRSIAEMRERSQPHTLFKGYAPVFAELLRHARELDFNEEPAYDEFIFKFNEVANCR